MISYVELDSLVEARGIAKIADTAYTRQQGIVGNTVRVIGSSWYASEKNAQVRYLDGPAEGLKDKLPVECLNMI